MTKTRKVLLYSSAAILFVIILLIFRLMSGPGVYCRGTRSVLVIPTGSNYNQVLDSIYKNFRIGNRSLFELIARKKNYPSRIKPGKYIIQRNLSYNSFLNLLRSGRQTPVDITFNNIKTLFQLAGKVGGQIEADSAQLAAFLMNPANYSADGFTKENIISVFIPDTYELYWNTTASGFYDKMLKEYDRFWSDERMRKAKEEKLTKTDVSTLASLVDEETTKPDEKEKIAGVYLNRLRLGMPLQSDPTIKFALGDFTITRVLSKQLLTNSPYNTYKHTGLPPGPIGCPTVEGIDAVLNASRNDYLYFVAKSDFSGYHTFSRTLAEHNRYAAMYQKELDKRKIFK